MIGLYIFGAGVSRGKLLKLRFAFPNVVFILIDPSYDIATLDPSFPVLIELGSLCDPGPGPSTFFGLKWSLLRTLELNLVPKENIGVVLTSLTLYAPGPS